MIAFIDQEVSNEELNLPWADEVNEAMIQNST